MRVIKGPYTLFKDTCVCCGSEIEYEQKDVKSGEWWTCPVCLYSNSHSSKSGVTGSRSCTPYWKKRSWKQISAEMEKEDKTDA